VGDGVSYVEQPLSLYGRLLSASDIEDALLDRLKFWVDDYLNEIERQHGLEVGSLARPRSWVVSSELEKFAEDQLPAVLVASPGTTEVPFADGHGRFVASWQIEVGVHIAAATNRHALRLARLHALALRAVSLQQVPEIFMRLDWMGERYDTLESVSDRTICTAHVLLEAQLADVTTRNAGPPAEPGWPSDGGPTSPEWPIAVEHDVELHKDPI
jgi:hypothetical protein